MAANTASGTIITAIAQGEIVRPALAHASADPLAALSTARIALESWSDLWSNVLLYATLGVVIGVAIEIGCDLWEAVAEYRVTGKLHWRVRLMFAGSFIVIVACAVEFWAEHKGAEVETQLRANNAAAQGVLDTRARNATQAAVDLADKFGGLRDFVDRQKGKIDEAHAEAAETLGELKSDRAFFSEARSAAESARTTAEQDAKGMTAALNEERDLRQQFAAMVVPRQISFTNRPIGA